MPEVDWVHGARHYNGWLLQFQRRFHLNCWIWVRWCCCRKSRIRVAAVSGLFSGLFMSIKDLALWICTGERRHIFATVIGELIRVTISSELCSLTSSIFRDGLLIVVRLGSSWPCMALVIVYFSHEHREMSGGIKANTSPQDDNQVLQIIFASNISHKNKKQAKEKQKAVKSKKTDLNKVRFTMVSSLLHGTTSSCDQCMAYVHDMWRMPWRRDETSCVWCSVDRVFTSLSHCVMVLLVSPLFSWHLRGRQVVFYTIYYSNILVRAHYAHTRRVARTWHAESIYKFGGRVRFLRFKYVNCSYLKLHVQAFAFSIISFNFSEHSPHRLCSTPLS